MKNIKKDYEKVVNELYKEFNKSQYETDYENIKYYIKNRKIIPEEKNEILSLLSNVDLYKLRLRCKFEIEQIKALDKYETMLINDIKLGKKRNFKQFIFSFKGNIDLKKIMDSYNKLIKDEEVLRCVYIYKDISHKTKIIYKHKYTTFPVSDISKMSETEHLNLIENVLATGARREYNPENDSVLKIQGFITDENRIVVIVSIYPYLNFNIGLLELLYRIFNDMKYEKNTLYQNDSKKLININDNLTQRNIKYWKELIGSVGEPLKIPGQLKEPIKNYEKYSVYKVIDKPIADKLKEYCLKNNVSAKSVILTAWADLIGEYQEQKEVVLGVLQKGNYMNLFPIKILRKDNFKEIAKTIDVQLADSISNSFCKLSDLEKEFNFKAEEYFQAVHHFIEFNEIDSLDDITQASDIISEQNIEEINANLRINYHMFGKELGINYIYKSNYFYDTTIDRLHFIFTQIIEQIILSERKKFNKHEYISSDDTDEERIRKLHIAQKALYIQKTNLFYNRTVEEIMELGEKSRLAQYSINDVCLEAEQSVCEIAILADGNIEESKTDFNGIVKSIRLLKPGNIFAVESLLDDNVTSCSYTAVCNEVKIVWINREDILPFLNQKPDNWRTILSAVNANANQMKKLWITVD